MLKFMRPSAAAFGVLTCSLAVGGPLPVVGGIPLGGEIGVDIAVCPRTEFKGDERLRPYHQTVVPPADGSTCIAAIAFTDNAPVKRYWVVNGPAMEEMRVSDVESKNGRVSRVDVKLSFPRYISWSNYVQARTAQVNASAKVAPKVLEYSAGCEGEGKNKEC